MAGSGTVYELTESELVCRLIQAGSPWLGDLFSFVVGPAVDWNISKWNYLLALNLPREAFGLAPGQPGDIDVLIIPERERLYPEKAIAVEVKRLVLPAFQRSRDANSSGAQQAVGMLDAGFPYVGILHIILPEPSPSREWRPLPAYLIIDDFGHAVPVAGPTLVDPIIFGSADRQLGRLTARVRDECIGLCALGLQVDATERFFSGSSTPSLRLAKRNPRVNRELYFAIEQIAKHLPIAAVI